MNKKSPSSDLTSSLIFKAADFVVGGSIMGDYFEFGVFNGSSLIGAYHNFNKAYEKIVKDYGFLMSEEVRGWVLERWDHMRFWGFDSFEGLPDVSGVDSTGPFKKGDYACDLPSVESRLKAAGVDMAKVDLVPGWFENSLTPAFKESLGDRKAAVIHIDCDLYESTKSVLAFAHNIITDGTVIIFDDWFQFRGHPNKGERRAFTEWLAANPQYVATEYHREGTWRNSFIINVI